MIYPNALPFLREIFAGDASGHDFYHTLRVYRNARKIAEVEGGNPEIIELAALLHDVDDPKLFGSSGGRLPNAERFFAENGISEETACWVQKILHKVSFKGTETAIPDTLEGKIVQDADRLDAIGAIGIARAFAYGGSRGRSIYLPDEKPKELMTAAEYAANQGTSINHFYEKLLLLKDRMNTPTAREMAARRHAFMEAFLAQFYSEWGE
ncbi:MAG: HD domain-containing protein [Planctomycetia bacterium]|nr:HD domain-containing protein [Planctomycetia bacterium]